MSKLSMFLPITKVDAAQRLVYGIATAEQVDKSNEVCDYATTKPLYEKWSGEFHKATDGKSLGNVRVMHGNAAVGKLTALNFNDEAKQIEICAKVVDDNEWTKVVEGVYTGFSQGGRYLKRWKDKDNATLTRYTAEPTEVSLVDNPCLPDATFTMVKEDGVEELRKFTSVLPAPVEPTKPEGEVAKADAPAAEADTDDTGFEQVWITKRLPGKQFSKKADMLKAITEAEAEDKVKELIAPLTKSVEEIQAALATKEPPKVEKTEYAAAPAPSADEVQKAKLDKAKTLVADFRKSFHATKEEKVLAKGISLYGASNLLQLLASVASAEDDLELPWYGTAVDKSICDRFGKVVVDLGEVVSDIIAKLLSDMKESEMSEVMAMAAKMGELTKIGARNSKSDAEKIQAIHDHACALGGECTSDDEDEDADKSTGKGDLAKVLAENAALTKALNGVPAILEDMLKRVKAIEAQPFVIPPHSGLNVVGKGGRVLTDESNGLLNKKIEDMTDADRDELAKIAIKLAHQNPNTRNA